MIGAHLLNRQYHVRKGLKISKWSEAVNRRRKRTESCEKRFEDLKVVRSRKSKKKEDRQ